MTQLLPPDSFSGTLDLRAAAGRRGERQEYILLSPLSYRTDLIGGGTILHIPPGFTTDFASIPWLAQVYLDDDDPCILRPSVVHDWVYAYRGMVPGLTTPIGRRVADLLLVEGMERLGARRDQRLAVWTAVRAFGWAAWGRRGLGA